MAFRSQQWRIPGTLPVRNATMVSESLADKLVEAGDDPGGGFQQWDLGSGPMWRSNLRSTVGDDLGDGIHESGAAECLLDDAGIDPRRGSDPRELAGDGWASQKERQLDPHLKVLEERMDRRFRSMEDRMDSMYDELIRLIERLYHASSAQGKGNEKNTIKFRIVGCGGWNENEEADLVTIRDEYEMFDVMPSWGEYEVDEDNDEDMTDSGSESEDSSDSPLLSSRLTSFTDDFSSEKEDDDNIDSHTSSAINMDSSPEGGGLVKDFLDDEAVAHLKKVAAHLTEVLDALDESMLCASYDSWMGFVPEGEFLSWIRATEFLKDLETYAGLGAVREGKRFLDAFLPLHELEMSQRLSSAQESVKKSTAIAKFVGEISENSMLTEIVDSEQIAEKERLNGLAAEVKSKI